MIFYIHYYVAIFLVNFRTILPNTINCFLLYVIYLYVIYLNLKNRCTRRPSRMPLRCTRPSYSFGVVPNRPTRLPLYFGVVQGRVHRLFALMANKTAVGYDDQRQTVRSRFMVNFRSIMLNTINCFILYVNLKFSSN